MGIEEGADGNVELHLEAVKNGDVDFHDDLVHPQRGRLHRVQSHPVGDLLRHVVPESINKRS